jgi:hypothetical protein
MINSGMISKILTLLATFNDIKVPKGSLALGDDKYRRIHPKPEVKDRKN